MRNVYALNQSNQSRIHECKTLLMCVNSYVGTYLVSIRFWGIANFDSQCCILLLWMYANDAFLTVEKK